jgi:hypothetical protein
MLNRSFLALWQAVRGLLVPKAGFPGDEEMPPGDNIDASPHLYNQRLAAYEWGSGEILLSPTAAFKKKNFFMKNVVSIDEGTIVATSKTDLVCLIAALHEFRHFHQDYLTGLGHWDYVARLNQIVSTISMAKHLAGDWTAYAPLDTWACDYLEQKASYILHKREDGEVDQIGQFLVEEMKQPREAARVLSTRRLLEMDAVLYTYSILHSSKFTLKALNNLREVRNYYDFTQMDNLYLDTITFCLTNFKRMVISDEPPKEWLDNIIFTIRLLLSIAFAHPDQETLNQLKHDPVHYIPGIRFFRMMLGSIKYMHGHGEPTTELENNLIRLSEFNYASFGNCESKWVEYFTNMEEQSNLYPATTDARREATQEKYDGAVTDDDKLRRSMRDSISQFSDWDLPLILTRTDGISHNSYITNRFIRVPTYDIQRVRGIFGWRLVEFLLRRRKVFLCPFARTHYCSVKVERCRHSYSDLSEVPDNEKCRVRQTCFSKKPTSFVL